MTFNLKKGETISLQKEAPNLTRVMCGLGWDLTKSDGLIGIFNPSENFDLDSSVLCLDANNKIKDTNDLVYYQNLTHPSNAITHLGDNLTGEGDGDDEQIIVDLVNIPSSIAKLVFTVNIYKCIEREQDFGKVKNAFVRLVDLSNNREIVRYNLSGEEYLGCTGMILAEIYRNNSDWNMVAIGKGINLESIRELAKEHSNQNFFVDLL